MDTRCPKTGRFNSFQLTDDGTLDTVVACSQCQKELRYNFDPAPISTAEQTEADREKDYKAFTEWACLDAAEQHEQEE